MSAVATGANPNQKIRIKVGDKAYPHHLRSEREQRDEASAQVNDQSVESRLFESIWCQLPFQDSECADTESLFQSYSESFDILGRMHAELGRMIRIACETNFYASMTGHDDNGEFEADVKKHLERIYQYADLKSMTMDNTCKDMNSSNTCGCSCALCTP